MQHNKLKFFVTADCSMSGTSKTGKPYRKQAVIVHNGDERRRMENMIDDNEAFLTPGEYRLADDCVYLGDSTREYNGRTYTQPALRVAPRFVPVVTVGAPPATK